jgi:hypothetical protein
MIRMIDKILRVDADSLKMTMPMRAMRVVPGLAQIA